MPNHRLCRLMYVNRLVSRMNVLRLFLAKTSRIMSAISSNNPVMTSMTAPMRVGKCLKSPVLTNSAVT